MSDAVPEVAPAAPPLSPGNGAGASDQGAEPIPLGRIPLFRDVPERRLQASLRECRRLSLAAGSVLLEPGQTNASIFVILAGRIEVHLDADGPADRGIAIPLGQCIGEFSAIDGQPVSALVRAATDAVVLELERDLFWTHLVALPGVARNLMKSLTERTRLTNQLALEAQRERLELEQLRKELSFARQLQAGMLPLQRPLFPQRRDLEICALLEPAASVAGDFFDAFFIDEDTLFLCIGDVSGHGIAASLLMARTVGLLRVLAVEAPSPHDLLARLNDRLVEGNEASLFVTLFCGYFHLPTGRLVYANGGHCPPLLIRENRAEPLPLSGGVLIGAFPGRTYRSLSVGLRPGDALFLYTDGITEAESPAARSFGLEGCIEVLGQGGGEPLTEVLDRLREQVRTFTGTATLEDDLTLLLLRRPAQ